jgi:hypothetical protein
VFVAAEGTTEGTPAATTGCKGNDDVMLALVDGIKIGGACCSCTFTKVFRAILSLALLMLFPSLL